MDWPSSTAVAVVMAFSFAKDPWYTKRGLFEETDHGAAMGLQDWLVFFRGMRYVVRDVSRGDLSAQEELVISCRSCAPKPRFVLGTTTTGLDYRWNGIIRLIECIERCDAAYQDNSADNGYATSRLVT